MHAVEICMPERYFESVGRQEPREARCVAPATLGSLDLK
jgi:hypothetical protein